MTDKKTTTTRKKNDVLYRVSWSNGSAEYSRSFNKEEERTYFIENYLKTVKYSTYESEV